MSVIRWALFALALCNDGLLGLNDLKESTDLGIDINCENYGSCDECIQHFTFGCGWCLDASDPMHGGYCFHAATEEERKENCPSGFVTFQDPHLYGEHCCFQYGESCQTCLEGQNYCQYCSSFQISEDKDPVPLCYHAQHASTVNAKCLVPIDKISCCSEHSGDCRGCLESSVCSFCYYSEECVYSSTGSSQPDNWCIYEEQSGVIDSCCDGGTCQECFDNSAADHNWNPHDPPCVWCVDPDSVKVGDDGTITSTGKCVPPLEKACPTANNESQMVLLGVDYCNDECYMGNTNCGDCVSEKTSKGEHCVWVEDPEYPKVDTEALIPMAQSFCVHGDMLGPAEDKLYFSQYMALKTIDYKGTYYFSTCSITNTALLTIIIVCSVVVFVGIIVTILVVTRVKQTKLKKLAREAEKKADAELGAMIDIRDPNALFKLWQEEVSWEDEFEKKKQEPSEREKESAVDSSSL